MIKNRRFTLMTGIFIVLLLFQINVSVADYLSSFYYLLLLLSQVIMIYVI